MKKLILSLIGVAIALTGCSDENINKTKDIINFFTDDTVPSGKNDESAVVSNFDPNGNYNLVSIDACDLSGDRVSNAKVDIGMDTDYATRDYFAYTNELGQLIHVEASDIILQNDEQESSFEKSDGRYCYDEAEVPGTESSELDQGHAIADSLGGVSNAYNITPQDSYLNRHGDQYTMEGDIRDYEAEGRDVTNFIYDISYDDGSMIPSSYSGSYDVNGDTVTFAFNNG